MGNTVTQAQAEEVLAALKRQQNAAIDAGWSSPVLLEDWDGKPFVIVWEEGPHEWPYLFPYGGFQFADVSGDLPAKVFVEPINHYSVGIYPA